MSIALFKASARYAGIYSAMLAAFVVCLPAQESRFEGRPIAAIEFVPSRQPLDPRDMARVQLLHIAEPLRASDVSETIERMFATGRYRNIEVAAEARGEGVLIRFLTEDALFVGHVGAEGKISNPPNASQLVAASGFDLGAPFHADTLAGAQQAIERLFTSNGLYDATAHLETETDTAHQQVAVHILVHAGPRARYEQPAIRGDTKLPASAIVHATGWKMFFIGRWRGVTQALTRRGVDGIEKKYQKVDRLTASVRLLSLDYDPDIMRVKPSLEIDAGPKIEIRAAQAKISKGRLKRYVPIYQEGAVDPDLLVEGARNLRDYFQSQGYPDVDVTFRQLPPTDDQSTIEYFINRGPRRKLVRVLIRGNRYFDTGTIRERMLLAPASFFERWGRYSEAFRNHDQQSIADLYKANGFRDVKVIPETEEDYRGKEDQVAVVFDIDEGRQWTVDSLDLSGVRQLSEKVILPVISETAGQPYSEYSVALDRTTILEDYASNGFRHATFEWTASPAGADRVHLHYEIVEGRREYVRDVLISGLTHTRRSVVENNLNIKAGQPLSLPADRQNQRDFYNLGIFGSVDTAVQNSDGDEIYKYVLFDFTEAHRYSLDIGVGAQIAQLGETTTNLASPTGGTGFSPRLTVNLNRLNLLGLGKTLALQTVVSNIEQKVGLSYLDPKLMNSPDRTLTVSVLYDALRDVRTFESKREEAAIQLSQKLSRSTTAFFRFSYRRVSTSDVVIPALLIPQFLQPVRIGMPSFNLVQDRRDNPVDPHTGMYNAIDLGLASSAFGSQRNFGKFLLRNATYYRIGKHMVFARQITFGAIIPYHIPAGFNSTEAVPLPERFFGGGDISDRAFPENQAGPRDTGAPVGPGAPQTEPTGFPLGGDAVLISNAELRFPLIGQNIGGVLFYDAGNVYRSLDDISVRFHQKNDQDFNYMVHAVGFGLRYKTPVGPLRADFAYSINPPRFVGFKGTVQDLLACNPNLPPSELPAVCQVVPQRISHFQFFFSIGQTF